MICKLNLCIFFLCYFLTSAAQQTNTKTSHQNQQIFWNELNKLCGKSFQGEVVNAPPNDTVFKNKSLVMHVRTCNDTIITIPFVVGEDRSRTWVFTLMANGLQLKHDHRHKDGTSDAITMYGGSTSNSGSVTMQMFPADEATVKMLPAAAMNIWWVELVPGDYFTYNLRRIGTDRLFTVRFDLTKTVKDPLTPWGW